MERVVGKPAVMRRRWMIGGFILVLVSMVSWWYWPRGDARFVGKWEVLVYGSDGVARPDGEVVVYRSNGRATQFINGVQQPRQFHWRVEGNDFVVETDWPTGFSEVQEIAMRLFGRLTGRPVHRPQLRFQIAEWSRSEILLHLTVDPARPVDRVLIRRVAD